MLFVCLTFSPNSPPLLETTNLLFLSILYCSCLDNSVNISQLEVQGAFLGALLALRPCDPCRYLKSHFSILTIFGILGILAIFDTLAISALSMIFSKPGGGGKPDNHFLISIYQVIFLAFQNHPEVTVLIFLAGGFPMSEIHMAPKCLRSIWSV